MTTDIYITQTEFREALERLGIDIKQCAELLGYHYTSAYRWLMPNNAVPQVVAIAVGLMLAKKVTPEGLKAVVEQRGYGRKDRKAKHAAKK